MLILIIIVANTYTVLYPMNKNLSPRNKIYIKKYKDVTCCIVHNSRNLGTNYVCQ